jgi:hypothetical protein
VAAPNYLTVYGLDFKKNAADRSDQILPRTGRNGRHDCYCRTLHRSTLHRDPQWMWGSI